MQFAVTEMVRELNVKNRTVAAATVRTSLTAIASKYSISLTGPNDLVTFCPALDSACPDVPTSTGKIGEMMSVRLKKRFVFVTGPLIGYIAPSNQMITALAIGKNEQIE